MHVATRGRVGRLGRQEIRIELKDRIQSEALNVQHLVQRDLAHLRDADRSARVHPDQARAQRIDFVRFDQVGL